METTTLLTSDTNTPDTTPDMNDMNTNTPVNTNDMNTPPIEPETGEIICPICLEKIIKGDKVITGCGNKKHYQHKECFDDMSSKTKLVCSICRTEGNYAYSRKPKICGCLYGEGDSIDSDTFECVVSACVSSVNLCCCPLFTIYWILSCPYYMCTIKKKRLLNSPFKVEIYEPTK